MTDQEKISRLANAAATRVSPWLMPDSRQVIPQPPFAIRKTLCAECHASNLPMPSFPRVAFYQEARVLLGDRKTGANHRRLRPRRRPPLAAATCCLLSCMSALFFNSPRGEESLTSVARTVIQASNEAGMMASTASD
jgi:hypothetical protein